MLTKHQWVSSSLTECVSSRTNNGILGENVARNGLWINVFSPGPTIEFGRNLIQFISPTITNRKQELNSVIHKLGEVGEIDFRPSPGVVGELGESPYKDSPAPTGSSGKVVLV